jgi:hypothetical protein
LRLSGRTANARAPQYLHSHPRSAAAAAAGGGARRLLVIAAVCAAGVGAASAQGCGGGDDGSGPAPELSGTYRLISAGGSPPPYIYWCSARGS